MAVLDEYKGHGAEAENYARVVRARDALGAKDFEIYLGDVRTIELPKAKWDYIYTRNTLHHIYLRQDPDEPIVDLFQKLHSWLRPGGCLRVGEISWVNVWGWSLFGKLLFPRMDFSTKSTAWRWRRCAQEAGLAPDHIWWYVPNTTTMVRLTAWRRDGIIQRE